MNPAFLDTVGLIALWDADDQWNAAAEAAYRAAVSGRLPFVTTTFNLLECGNAAARRPYRSEVGVLRRTLEQHGSLVVPTEQDWRDAWDAFDRGEAGQAGIVDHVSFAVMRRLGLTKAFTNDRHFRAAGFETLF